MAARTRSFRYMELASTLRTRILSGQFKPGQLLLSENELCQKYDMSRNSVRQSLEVLVGEMLVERKAGIGTLVTYDYSDKKAAENQLTILTGFPLTYVKEAMPHLIRIFRNRYPNVDVKIISIPHPEDFFTGEPLPFEPDLVLIDDQDCWNLLDERFLPQTKAIQQQEFIAKKLLYPFQQDGALYAVPVTFSPIYMMCNRDMFQRYEIPIPTAGWTTEQFAQTAQKLTLDSNHDGIDDVFGFCMSSELSRLATVLLKSGVDFNRVKREPLIHGLKLIQDLIHRYRVTPNISLLDSGWMYELFVEHRIAMFLTSRFYGVMKTPFNTDVVPFPNSKDSGNMLLSLAFGIPRTSGNPELAKLFCELASSMDVQSEITEQTGLLSVYDDVNLKFLSKQHYEAMCIDKDSINRSYYVGELFPSKSVSENLERTMRSFWAGLITPEEMADRMLGDAEPMRISQV